MNPDALRGHMDALLLSVLEVDDDDEAFPVP